MWIRIPSISSQRNRRTNLIHLAILHPTCAACLTRPHCSSVADVVSCAFENWAAKLFGDWSISRRNSPIPVGSSTETHSHKEERVASDGPLSGNSDRSSICNRTFTFRSRMNNTNWTYREKSLKLDPTQRCGCAFHSRRLRQQPGNMQRFACNN